MEPKLGNYRLVMMVKMVMEVVTVIGNRLVRQPRVVIRVMVVIRLVPLVEVEETTTIVAKDRIPKRKLTPEGRKMMINHRQILPIV